MKFIADVLEAARAARVVSRARRYGEWRPKDEVDGGAEPAGGAAPAGGGEVAGQDVDDVVEEEGVADVAELRNRLRAAEAAAQELRAQLRRAEVAEAADAALRGPQQHEAAPSTQDVDVGGGGDARAPALRGAGAGGGEGDGASGVSPRVAPPVWHQ